MVLNIKNNLLKIAKLKALLEQESIPLEQLRTLVSALVTAVKKAVDDNKETSKESQKILSDTLTYLEKERESIIFGIKDDSEKRVAKLENKTLKVLDKALKVIESVKNGEDGQDGRDADETKIVDEVLKKIPPPEKVELDDGEKIVEKINDLEIEPDKQIDASHIKNFPKEVGKHIIAHSRNLDFFDETTLVISNPTQIKFAGAGVQITQEANTGALLVTIAGGAAATEEYETMTDSGDHINYTLSATPNAGTLLVINSNTGQIVEPSRYTNTGTAVVFTSSQEVEGETPVFMARFAH